ncbi:MAG: adenylosuccinate lyase family protein [Chloroflexota bacterium]
MTLTSEIFADLFSTAEMREVFSDKMLVNHYLRIERDLALVQADLGIIPHSAAQAIQEKAQLENIDWAAFVSGIPKVGVPIMPLVRQIIAAVGEDGEWVHYGATTQDIMDTAVVLQVQAAINIIDRDLNHLRHNLTALAKKHRSTPMAGRSQSQQALPISFGLKVANWLTMIVRHQERLSQLKPRVLIGQFGGAVGTLASLGDQGLEVQEKLCQVLNLEQPLMSWHTARDGFAEAVTFLGLLTGTLAKIGQDIALMSQNEIGELSEPFSAGRGGSSTMPQKRNPLSAQRMMVAGRLTKQQVAVMLEAMVNDHERGTGVWPMEWVALPEAFLLSAISLTEAISALGDLQVYPERMQKNLALSKGLLVSEAVMMALAPKIGRMTAHDLVEEAVHMSLTENIGLADALLQIDLVTRWLSTEDIQSLTTPANYMGLSEKIVDRVIDNVTKAEK